MCAFSMSQAVFDTEGAASAATPAVDQSEALRGLFVSFIWSQMWFLPGAGVGDCCLTRALLLFF